MADGWRDRPYVATTPAMGTVASVHVHDDAADALVQQAVAAVFAELDRLEAIFSTFRPSSEISRINRGELSLLDASGEVVDVLDACTWLEHTSAGAFSARRPAGHPQAGDLDPAGFVKGWASERAARFLLEADLRNWYLNVGGDLLAHGQPAPGTPWRVGVADPLRPGRVLARLDVVDGAVATSGTAERGRHLWDPRTGGAAAALASFTVTGPTLTWADAFATAAFVMGSDGLAWLAQFDGYHGVAVTLDGELLTTPALGRRPAQPPTITSAGPATSATASPSSSNNSSTIAG